jgi:hypothetical protein
LADFGVGRHTLVTGKITQVFHHSSVAVTQVPATMAHLFRMRAQLPRRFSGSTCPIQEEFKDSSLTQLRGRQGASFAWFLVKFRKRNHLGCIFQTLGVRHFGRTHPRFSSDHQIRSREALSTHFTIGKAIILRHISTHSDGGITRA